jgi:pyruvate/2-oxoglutarate/acetoin dehydrogenase E1 component
MPWTEFMLKAQSEQQAVDLGDGRVLTYTEALKEALTIALDVDPKTFVMGQGVDDPGGMFGVTKGLPEKFGADRVFDTPLSEDAMTGIALGASMNRLRPVYMHNRPDFLLLTFNQLVNHAAKIHWMDVGQITAPMVVWAAIGRGWGSGPQHSQSIQGLLLSVPGLKIVMPSTPHDAKGLMLSAIADNNPVLIFEHRWLMKQKGIVPEGLYKIAIGKGVCRRPGKDLTIVGASHAIRLAEDAAKRAEDEGIDAEVIDLRTIKPLDEDIILESVSRTGRLLVVDTGWQMGGVCAEICALVAEKAFHDLKAPVARLGLPDVSTPAGFTLEQLYYPTEETVLGKIRDLMRA